MSVTSSRAASRRAPRTAAASVALALGAAALTGVGTVSGAETAQAAETTYTVRSGDGWWIIAQRTGVSMSTLQSLNGMTAATVLHPGMVLKTSGTATPAPAPAPSTSGSTYTVLAGDGWWIISYRTGVSASILQSINGMSSSTMLHPGMVLKTTSVSTSTTSARSAAPAPAPASKHAAVDYVRAAVRNPSSYYAWGGNGPSGFDCSGLTQQAMAQAGISIPRRAGDQYLAAKSYVPISQAQPGDLVFYANQSTGRIFHVAMYMGGGQLAHALNEDAGLVFTSTSMMKSDMLAVAARY
ncbi:LysM peptidoglycan-binding domain-containing C40 family peptidase [Micrococcus luteus]|uniref:LysM peptidoglycan-binding domain-containing C40 family peptidase n=1 Tax=Micrococcus luteus TaxID=1270 RepID=UPI0015D71FF1|nr:LysM peptidoglycan-binding domain-containing C40 family peptidase [Micrococcus luteus]